jgi:hypothetical protein
MPCWFLRAESESFCESLFESASKANTYGIAGTVTKAPQASARLTVKVVPGSSRDGIVGWLGDALKIKVTAPPREGACQRGRGITARRTARVTRRYGGDGDLVIARLTPQGYEEL